MQKSIIHKAIIIFFVCFLSLVGVLIVWKYKDDGTLLSIIYSWSVIATRGKVGDIDKLGESISLREAYRDELIGDVLYRHGSLSGALSSYRESLRIEKNPRVEEKITILSHLTGTPKKEEEKNKSPSKEIEESLSRIEKDTQERSLYLNPTGNTYENISPIFEDKNKEIIDW